MSVMANSSNAVSNGINSNIKHSFLDTPEQIAKDIVNGIINTLPNETLSHTKYSKHHVKTSEIRIGEATKGIPSRSLPYVPVISRTNLRELFKQLFLPSGFPETVSSDYAQYQVWDSLQAFFSTLTGALTTHSIMKSVGVGDANATAVSAAMTWILRDGTGLIGRIVFGYWKGTQFDRDCKKWRLFADILNDTAMFIECLIPIVTPSKPLYLLCLSTTMKSLVGVAGGATRAAIMQHQAIHGNMADVSAKDQSQEACVNLIASLVAMLILMTVADSRFKWDMFMLFVFCHLACNYRAVKAVELATLNTARFVSILRCFLVLKTVGNVKVINRNESVIIGRGLQVPELCGYKVNLGASISHTQIPVTKLIELQHFYDEYNYILYLDNVQESIQIFLKSSATSIDIIQAFYHAIILGVATCIKNHTYLVVISRQVQNIDKSPMDYLVNQVMNPSCWHRNHADSVMKIAEEAVQLQFPTFLSELHRKGWDTEHLLFDM